jgi:hypothetical protein
MVNNPLPTPTVQCLRIDAKAFSPGERAGPPVARSPSRSAARTTLPGYPLCRKADRNPNPDCQPMRSDNGIMQAAALRGQIHPSTCTNTSRVTVQTINAA